MPTEYSALCKTQKQVAGKLPKGKHQQIKIHRISIRAAEELPDERVQVHAHPRTIKMEVRSKQGNKRLHGSEDRHTVPWKSRLCKRIPVQVQVIERTMNPGSKMES